RAADQGFAKRDDVRQVVDLAFLDEARPRQERLDRLVRNRVDRFVERRGANARRQALEAAAAAGVRDLRSALDLNRRAPVVEISERQDVTGEDQMRVLDLRIDLPD